MRRLVLLALLSAGCVAPSPDILDAMRAGRGDAERDVGNRLPRLAYIGMEVPGIGPLDAETGLVRFSVGCCKSRERIAYRDAYNDAVDEARDAGRLAGLSFAHKQTTRAALVAALAGPGVALVKSGAPGAPSPDGRFVVEVGPGAEPGYEALWLTDRTTGFRGEIRFLGGREAKVLFAGDGTTLWVRDDGARVHETIDVPSGLLLQLFPDPETGAPRN